QEEGGYQACVSEDSLRTFAGLPSIGQFCATNPNFHFTAADAAAARAANNNFPFGFTKSPFQVSVGISLPIFNGLQRADQLEQAQAQREDARYDIRKQQLQNTQTVTSAYLILETDHQTIAMQQQNAAAARQALELAQEKYRVGAASFIDLNTASVTYAQAENEYITAVYEYHKAFAALEAAVGQPLR
ncbi:MAG TPA: TolC family protein, partial [Gemmatimonadaceae bacterium]|nr:TolC family protein [Gemmatimonadaceae bacterium]